VSAKTETFLSAMTGHHSAHRSVTPDPRRDIGHTVELLAKVIADLVRTQVEQSAAAFEMADEHPAESVGRRGGEGRTIVAVTHDDRWFATADEVWKMEYGRPERLDANKNGG
jgi:hypothetical protein